MSESTVQVFTATTNRPVQVGVPAEDPNEALAVLIKHFNTRPQVRSVVVGLLRFLDSDELGSFTYTIGITCSTDRQREVEEELAAEALRAANVTTGRWPIAFFPPRTRFFTSEARAFYPEKKLLVKQSLLQRLQNLFR